MLDRTTAKVTGLLFVVASISAIVGGILALPAANDDGLLEASSQDAQVVTGSLVEMILAGWLIAKGFRVADEGGESQ